MDNNLEKFRKRIGFAIWKFLKISWYIFATIEVCYWIFKGMEYLGRH